MFTFHGVQVSCYKTDETFFDARFSGNQTGMRCLGRIIQVVNEFLWLYFISPSNRILKDSPDLHRKRNETCSDRREGKWNEIPEATCYRCQIKNDFLSFPSSCASWSNSFDFLHVVVVPSPWKSSRKIKLNV